MREPEPHFDQLTDAEKELLRKVARVTIEAAVRGEAAPDTGALARLAGVDLEPRLAARRGAFVTLHLAGQLRGCIGYIEGHMPLIDAVARNGRAAALEDPRFPPVNTDELPHLDLEVSALTPLHEVERAQDIVIGRHGILLAKQGRQAVFLPQVAPEQGWDLETTLGHLALKAGFGPTDWQKDACFKVFEAEVF